MPVTVISKSGCHLCENVISALESLSEENGFELRVLDIQQDRALHDRYWLRIPVVLVGDAEVFDANDIDKPSQLRDQLKKFVS